MSDLLKKIIKPKDMHMVTSAKYGRSALFTAQGVKKWSVPSLCEGQHDNWKVARGDTPPGLYKAGQIFYQDGSDIAQSNSYGPICIDLIDLEGQETGYGRAGISAHGGGTGLPNPLADFQLLIPTHGCIRLHNHDMIHRVTPAVKWTRSQGGVFYWSVVDRD